MDSFTGKKLAIELRPKERVPSVGSFPTFRRRTMLSESSNFTAGTPDRARLYDQIPEIIRAELNADTDRELLVRMGDLAHRKRILRPDITDVELADYLALAENFPNFEQWINARRMTLQGQARAGAGWITATAVILGLLTVMLIMAIAVTV
jgi:hypothetical protein